MKDTQQETGFLNGLQHKTLYIEKLEVNQSKAITVTVVIIDQLGIATSSCGRIIKKLQQNIGIRVVKFVQNANT